MAHPGNEMLAFLGLLLACTAALGSYALAVRLGEGGGAAQLAVRPVLPGLLAGAALGLLMMAALMGVLAVTEELWMRALLLRLLWHPGPYRLSPAPPSSSPPCTWRTRELPCWPVSVLSSASGSLLRAHA